MKRNLDTLKKNTYDLLVVGGGINGAAISYLASAAGLNVALIEKGDFASGTSSKSSKLVHGGIRYLESFQFSLVREALLERYIHLKEVPHLVKPLPFIIPVYSEDKRPLWFIQLGVFLYDLMSGKYNIQKFKKLTRDEIIQMEPALKQEGLKGGFLYYDAQMDDARLCLENILSAHATGADVANYCEVKSFLKKDGVVTGVRVKDLLLEEEREFDVKAEKVICAAGPWTNELLKMDDPSATEVVRTTKGIHIVYPKKLTEKALVISSSKDKRIFFVIPWQGNSLIGTTETDYSDNLDNVTVDEKDIDYLLEETKRVFPHVNINKNEPFITFAGLRPLVKRKGNPSKISREHMIFESNSKITFVVGGKYTTYRKVALDCLSRFIYIQPSLNHPLYGGGSILDNPKEIMAEYGLDLEVLSSLMGFYGSRYKEVLRLIKEDASLKETVCPHNSIIRAQIKYAFDYEMAQKEEDVIYRRLSIGYNACLMNECKEHFKKAIAEINPK